MMKKEKKCTHNWQLLKNEHHSYFDGFYDEGQWYCTKCRKIEYKRDGVGYSRWFAETYGVKFFKTDSSESWAKRRAAAGCIL